MVDWISIPRHNTKLRLHDLESEAKDLERLWHAFLDAHETAGMLKDKDFDRIAVDLLKAIMQLETLQLQLYETRVLIKEVRCVYETDPRIAMQFSLWGKIAFQYDISQANDLVRTIDHTLPPLADTLLSRRNQDTLKEFADRVKTAQPKEQAR